jgi:hypothetical protein
VLRKLTVLDWIRIGLFIAGILCVVTGLSTSSQPA